MSVETHHQTATSDKQSELSSEQQAWIDYQENLKREHPAPEESSDDEDFFETVFNEEVVPLSEVPTAESAPTEEKGASRMSRLKSALGARATKWGKMWGITILPKPEEPKQETKPEDSETTTSDGSEAVADSSKMETEKQPRFNLVDIKARAVKLVDRTKYNLGLAKEIGAEVKDILVEKAKDTYDTAKDKAGDAKEKAIRTKDIGIGFAQFAAYEGLTIFGALAAKAAEWAKSAPTKLGERFTDAAPTSSNPNNRELNRRGKILVVGLGVAAYAGMLYFGAEGNTDSTTDLANQVPLDNPGVDAVFPDVERGQLPIQPDVIPDVSSDTVPDVIDTTVEPTTADLKADFSPEVGTLEAGDNIWDDSMQTLKEAGFNGSESDLIDRTNLLTEWRLKEMGLSPDQAKFLPEGTKLPMPEFADLQELIAKAEQLKR